MMIKLYKWKKTFFMQKSWKNIKIICLICIIYFQQVDTFVFLKTFLEKITNYYKIKCISINNLKNRTQIHCNIYNKKILFYLYLFNFIGKW